jgi:hypothetical protein
VRVAYIAADGSFEFAGLRSASYLLEIYNGGRPLYQKVVSTESPQPLEISGIAPEMFSKPGWHPSDMTASESSIFVLDNTGIVSRLSTDPKGSKIDKLFRLESAYDPVAITDRSLVGTNQFMERFPSAVTHASDQVAFH